MAKPESTQFFQFDHEGNMYVFAPGAGCTGDAKLVTPGDEMIFTTTTQWQEREAPVLSQVAVKEEVNVGSTCPTGDVGRPIKPPLGSDALKELSHKNFSSETLKKVRMGS